MKAKPAAPGAPRGRKSGSSSAQSLVALAEAQLQQSSVRVTAARVKVLAALLGAGRAFSHQDIQDTLADMDRVTLYRALDCLTEAGLTHKIPGDDRIFRYSAGAEHAQPTVAQEYGRHTPHHQHGHFKCTRCAKVFCLDSIGEAGLLQNALEESLGKGFQSHDIEFTIKGWCADCAH